ncbi:MAG: hypothetical protein EAZ92_17565 [Candidatus Kapaibacterium sp.]|nr:MAG: hypothetical protein EAZ92_17565 [Candidatus Kapabacteria bacterium]
MSGNEETERRMQDVMRHSHGIMVCILPSTNNIVRNFCAKVKRKREKARKKQRNLGKSLFSSTFLLQVFVSCTSKEYFSVQKVFL